jgi:hypothetical protein
MEAAYGGADHVDAARLAELTERFRIKHLPATAIPAARRRLLAQVDELLLALEDLIVAIHTVSGSRVIVDSSKNPSFGYLLHAIPRLDVYDLHFIRHPAAVAYSWQKRKDFESGRSMPRRGPLRSGGQWVARNVGVERFIRPRSAHFAAVRYEDFISDPAPWVDAITEWLGEPSSTDPFAGPEAVDLREVSHSVFGNQTRFQRGIVQMQRDDRWLTQMEQKDLRVIGLVTRPLLARYGYALHPPTIRPDVKLIPPGGSGPQVSGAWGMP